MPDYGNMSLREELEARFKEAEQREQEAEFLSRGWRPPAGYGMEEATKTEQNAPFLTPGQRAWRSLKHDFADMGYGMKRGLSGATFGASDWALRKLGVSDDDYLAEREAEGLGTAVKGAGFVSELGGNMLGAGGALIKGGSKLGLKGLKLASTAGGIEGAAYGLTGSDSLDEVLPNMAIQGTMGALIPVGMYGAGKGLKAGLRPFSSRFMTEGMHGGLENVSNNPDAIKILERGIRKNDDVAQTYLNKVHPATRNINSETARMVDDSLTSCINVPETIRTERARYADFMNKHGADEVLNFAPTKEQLKAMQAQSKFNPNKYTREQAENVLRDRAKRQDLGIYNDELSYLPNAVDDRLGIQHMLGGEKSSYVRTINNTLNNPDLTFTQNGKDYFVKKYINSDSGKDFYDLVFTKGDDLFNKYPKNKVNGLINQINDKKMLTQNMSLSERVPQSSGGGTYPQHPYETINTIPYRSVVVNPDLPHVNSLYDGLTEFQAKELKSAFNSGLSKTNAKAGSLESLNKVKQELNERISKAQVTDKPSEVWQLNELKGKFEGFMPDNLKEVDAGFARAKRLEDAYNQGMHYNPNNVTGADNIAALGADEQNAFAQGMFKRINNNSTTNKDLAKTALGYENTLSRILPAEGYNPLIEGLNNQSTRFGRLANMGSKTESRLQTPEAGRFFGREQLESKGSIIGSGLDYMNDLLRGRAVRDASMNLMNPEFRGIPVTESWIVRNPALAAGIYPTVVNNFWNGR